MASYQNAVVYAIRSHQTDKFYIGSTRTPMYKRMSQHRRNYKQWCSDNTQKYVSSYEIVKYDDAYIELIEECPCENAAQLHKKEGEHIRLNHDMCVNIVIAGRKWDDYYKDNKEHRIANSKAYVETHKEETKSYQRQYRETHKKDINLQYKIYKESHKEQIQAMRKAHYEAHKEESKIYRESHKEQRKASREANRERENQLQRERRAKAKATKADAP